MIKLSRLALFSFFGVLGAAVVTVSKSLAIAQEPPSGGTKENGTQGFSTSLPPSILKSFSEPSWQPRMTPMYSQYMIKSIQDAETYKSESEAKVKLGKNPKDWKSYATLAERASFKEQWQECFQFYRKVLMLYPENYFIMDSFAHLLLAVDKTGPGQKEAIKMLQTLSKGAFYQQTRRARITLRELGYKTPDPEAEFVTDPYTGQRVEGGN